MYKYSIYMYCGLNIPGLKGDDVIQRYPGIAFMHNYNEYLDVRARSVQALDAQALDAFHE